jgi:two-component system NarL family response regulator
MARGVNRRAASDPIRVAIVDDHPIVAEGTAALLRGGADLDVVAIAGSLDAAVELGLDDAATVDVVLLDIRLGADSGLRFLAPEGAGSESRPAVLVLTAYDYPQYAEAARRLGAAGLVLKTAPLPELAAAIRRVAAGGEAFAAGPVSGEVAVRLTPRERDVLALLVEGRSNDEIGLALGIGSKTVETHVARMFERSGAASRTELATRAVREGWLDVPVG